MWVSQFLLCLPSILVLYAAIPYVWEPSVKMMQYWWCHVKSPASLITSPSCVPLSFRVPDWSTAVTPPNISQLWYQKYNILWGLRMAILNPGKKKPGCFRFFLSRKLVTFGVSFIYLRLYGLVLDIPFTPLLKNTWTSFSQLSCSDKNSG